MSKLPLSLLVAGATLLNATAAADAASYGPAFYPNDPFFAYSSQESLKNFAGQWHLVNLAPDDLTWSYTDALGVTYGGVMKNAHLDVNIKGAWSMGVTGKGVVIGIIDNGVEGDHEDLAPNYREDLSKNFSSIFGDTPQRPINPSDEHGTSVAGVAAARGGNGIGVTGAAPYAQIAGQRVSLTSSPTDPMTVADMAEAFLWYSGVDTSGKYLGEAQIHVKNNSWGSPYPFLDVLNPEIGNTLNKNSAEMLALKNASANNVIFVFASGNSRGDYYEQSQTTTRQGNEVVITVAALGSNGKFSSYSSLGPNVFVTAPSNSAIDTYGITTTDRVGILGYNSYVPPADTTTTPTALTNLPDNNYTNDFGGTSSASPLVAGIIALGKQVAPAMDVRLAKHALAKTSRIVDAEDNSLAVVGGRGWTKNAAGISFNANYGFGLIDATAFVNKVIDSAYVTDRTVYSTGTVSVGKAIVVGDTAGVVEKFTVPVALANQPIETVEARIKVEGPGVWQDLHIALTSPSGTTGDLLLYNNILQGNYNPAVLAEIYQANNEDIPGFDWSFTANNFWGENVAGEWTLQAWNRGFLGLGGNINLAEYEVTFNMGKMVLESDAQSLRIGQGVSIKAHSLNLDYANFSVEAGGTFTVTDSVNVYGGTVRVAGVFDEGVPATNPEFFKGSLVTVAKGGAFRVEAGGKLVATRGIDVAGGDFINYGTLEIGGGSVAVNSGGTFYTAQNLAVQGSVNVGEDGNGSSAFAINSGTDYDPKGTLAVGTDFAIGAGLVYVPETIAVTGKSSINGGRVVTTAYTGSEIVLSGGALSANTLAASSVTVNYGILNIAGNITGPDADTPVSVSIGGEADKGKRGWYSAGGIGPLGEDLRGIGNLLFASKTAGAAAPIAGNITTAKVGERYVVQPTVIQGTLSISQYGMLLVDAKNFYQPNGVVEILNDVVHVTGSVDFRGALYINNIADKDGKLPHPKVGDTITLITTDVGSNKIESGSIDTTYATMAPTLRYDVRSRDWVSEAADAIIENGEIYAIAIRDYAPAAAAFTPNQQAVAGMFANLWYDYQRAKGLASAADAPRPIGGNDSSTYGPVPFPPVTRPENNDIDASPDAPDGYAYEHIFSSIDSVSTFDQLRSLYTQLAPANSIILEQTFRQQTRAQAGAVRNRAREARSSFIQPGSLWTSSLFGESYGFNYAQSYDGYNEDQPVTLWLNGGGSYSPGRGNKNTSGYDSKTWNAAFGADYRFSNAFLLGLQVSYSGNQTNIKGSGLKNSTESIFGALYAAGNAGSFYYNALAGYSGDSHTFKRNLNFGADSDLSGSHKGTPSGGTALVSVEIGYEWTTRSQDGFAISSPSERGGYWSYGPSLALQYYRANVNSYTESGGNDFNSWQQLSVAKQTYESFSSQLGFQLSRVINFEAVTILPELRVSWIHEFNTDAQTISARLNSVPGAESFRIHGNKPSSDYANLGLGLSMRISPRINASLNYDCYAFLKDSDPSHQFTATVRVNF